MHLWSPDPFKITNDICEEIGELQFCLSGVEFVKTGSSLTHSPLILSLLLGKTDLDLHPGWLIWHARRQVVRKWASLLLMLAGKMLDPTRSPKHSGVRITFGYLQQM